MSLRLELKAVASPALIARGCVNVVGLEPVRRRIGARWEKMRDPIRARLEALLAHKLGPTDFFAPLSETSYLIAMPSLEGDDARLCCLKIAYELHKSLLGTCALDDIAIAHVGGGDMNSLELTPLATDELAGLASKGGLGELCAGLAPPISRKSIDDRDLAVAPPRFRFTPIWDAPREAISSYRLEMAAVRPAGDLATPGSLAAGLELFMAGTNYAARLLIACLRAGGRYLTVLPVPFDILSVPHGRMEIAAVCRNLPSELRRFLVFEIADAPIGVPQSRMTDLVCALRPFCHAVTVIMPLGAADTMLLRNAGHQGIGFRITPFANPAVVRDSITRLTSAARRLDIASVVSGIRSREWAAQACDAGVNYLSGAFIGGGVEVPLPMSRLFRHDLLVYDGIKARKELRGTRSPTQSPEANVVSTRTSRSV